MGAQLHLGLQEATAHGKDHRTGRGASTQGQSTTTPASMATAVLWHLPPTWEQVEDRELQPCAGRWAMKRQLRAPNPGPKATCRDAWDGTRPLHSCSPEPEAGNKDCEDGQGATGQAAP